MKILEQVPLSTLTTMQIGGPADYVLEIETPNEVASAYEFAESHKLPIFILGTGANALGRDEGYRGVILKNMMTGIEIIEQTADRLTIKAYGGEIWDTVVEKACTLGYSGIEGMSGIPGTVGAAPVQNIGAYGQEIADTLVNTQVYDSQTKQIITLDKTQMQMSYRQSIFNQPNNLGRYFIIAITISLRKTELKPPFYTSLQALIDQRRIQQFAPQTIRELVLEIRDSKIPSPKVAPSAGSFFKNIEVTPEQIPALRERGIVVWENADGSGKVNSGWLLQEAGLSGQVFYGFEVNEKAALILINRNGKTYTNLARARQKIRQIILEKFGLKLEQEPMEIV